MAGAVKFSWDGPDNWTANRELDTPLFWDTFRQFYARAWLADRVRRGVPVTDAALAAIEEALQ